MKQLRSSRHRVLMAALVEARQAAGLSQRQLTAKLKRSSSFVWKTETGERRLDVLEFIEIARALDVDPVELLGRVLR